MHMKMAQFLVWKCDFNDAKLNLTQTQSFHVNGDWNDMRIESVWDYWFFHLSQISSPILFVTNENCNKKSSSDWVKAPNVGILNDQ